MNSFLSKDNYELSKNIGKLELNFHNQSGDLPMEVNYHIVYSYE